MNNIITPIEIRNIKNLDSQDLKTINGGETSEGYDIGTAARLTLYAPGGVSSPQFFITLSSWFYYNNL
jgi:hypothetical protein